MKWRLIFTALLCIVGTVSYILGQGSRDADVKAAFNDGIVAGYHVATAGDFISVSMQGE